MHRTVIYTAIYGLKDKLIEPAVIPPGCDFVCFSDFGFQSKVWEVRNCVATSEDPVRSAKLFKILPHKFFPDYEYSVWIDGNILVRGDVNKLIDLYLQEADIAFFDHRATAMDPCGNVSEEANALLDRARQGKMKDDPELIQRQMQRYKDEGFPDDGGLIVGMEIIRRHNSPNVIRVMEDWWAEIQNGSRRDQLSFNYVAWRNKLPFTYMEGDARDNKYFLWRPHQ